jgi:hypothetical protein
MGEEQEKDHQQAGHQQIVNVRLQKVLVIGKQSLQKARLHVTYTGQAPRQPQCDRQRETPGYNQDVGLNVHERIPAFANGISEAFSLAALHDLRLNGKAEIGAKSNRGMS